MIVTGGYVITPEKVWRDAGILVKGGKIDKIGLYDDLKKEYPEEKTIGGSEFIVSPGLVNSHHHGRGLSTFQLGTTDDVLENFIFALRAERTTDIYYDTLYSALRLLRTGVTTVLHSHRRHTRRNAGLKEYIEDINTTIRAYKDAGIRVVFAMEMQDRGRIGLTMDPSDDANFFESLPSDLKEKAYSALGRYSLIPQEDYFAVARDTYDQLNKENDLVTLALGSLIPFNCSDELMGKMALLQKELGICLHMHLQESLEHRRYAKTAYPEGLLRRLQKVGILNSKSSFAHGVWLNETDLDVIAETGASIVHCPSANLRLRSGIAPVLSMLERGIVVALGMDGTTINDNEDIFMEMRLARNLHRPPLPNLKPLSSTQCFKMVTTDGASVVGLGSAVGALEPGRCADMILLDHKRVCGCHAAFADDPVELLNYRATAQCVDTVIVNGKVVVSAGRHADIDEAELEGVLAEKASRSLTPDEKEYRNLIFNLAPYFVRHRTQAADPSIPVYMYNSGD